MLLNFGLMMPSNAYYHVLSRRNLKNTSSKWIGKQRFGPFLRSFSGNIENNWKKK
jgi:hypothetical protein